MRKDWPQVRISDVQIGNEDRQNIHVGDSLQVAARVHLGRAGSEACASGGLPRRG